jgi:hypothetical protein
MSSTVPILGAMWIVLELVFWAWLHLPFGSFTVLLFVIGCAAYLLFGLAERVARRFGH